MEGWRPSLSSKSPFGIDHRQMIDWSPPLSGRCQLCIKHRYWSSRQQLQWNMSRRCMPGRCWTDSRLWHSSTLPQSTPHSSRCSNWRVELSGLGRLGWSSILLLQNIQHCTCSCTGMSSLPAMLCWRGMGICYPTCTSCLARMVCIWCRLDRTGSGNIHCMRLVHCIQCW